MDPTKPQLLLLGTAIGLNASDLYGQWFEIAVFVLLGLCTAWMLVDMYNKGPAHG